MVLVVNSITTIGKQYKIKIGLNATSTVSTVVVRGYNSGTNHGAVASGAEEIIEFTADDTIVYLYSTSAAQADVDVLELTQIGCVAQYEPENLGHGQTIDSSGNELHGTVNGPILFGHPANHTEKYVDLSLTGNSSFTLPMGYKITSIVAKETAGNALTGGLDVGFSANGTEVVSGEAIGASATVNCTLVASGVIGETHTTTDDTIYFSDGDDDGNWNSAELEVRVEMIRLTVN